MIILTSKNIKSFELKVRRSECMVHSIKNLEGFLSFPHIIISQKDLQGFVLRLCEKHLLLKKQIRGNPISQQFSFSR